MRTYSLTDDFVDQHLERSILTAFHQHPRETKTLRETIPLAAFAAEPEAWAALSTGTDTERLGSMVDAWRMDDDASGGDCDQKVKQLLELMQHRLAAGALERMAHALRDDSIPSTRLHRIAESCASELRALSDATDQQVVSRPGALIDEILSAAAARVEARRAGRTVIGISTGLSKLDATLNGLTPGLTILAGGPGMGKTTMANQIAANAARETPVLYVSFENSPANLALKSICSLVGLNPADVQRGRAETKVLESAARQWAATNSRLAFVAGTSQLTVDGLGRAARSLMQEHVTKQCLIVVDYLQLWAKTSAEFQSLPSVRERVETMGARLREMAVSLSAPVLAIASQNRANGNYGGSRGGASIDSLKESGDLEYMADVVLFLTPSERMAPAPARVVDLAVGKNRDGESGGVFNLIFRPDLSIFHEETRY